MSEIRLTELLKNRAVNFTALFFIDSEATRTKSGFFQMQSYLKIPGSRRLGLRLAVCSLQSYEIKCCTRQCETRRAIFEYLVLWTRLYDEGFRSGSRT